ncbi:hypothetical protein OGN88_003479 [Vibrio cholerae]|nr:hypothetical protein [Vibrio cholerae]EKF9785825.1 hypothetical protein [Vibrio cholerae]
MNEINKRAMELNEECFSVLSEISEFKPQFYHLFNTKKFSDFELKLRGLREKLSKLDKDIAPIQMYRETITLFKWEQESYQFVLMQEMLLLQH